MIKRAVLVLSLLLLPLAATAQQNELGVFISTSQLESSDIEDAGDLFEVDFEEDMGFGVLYNRFWVGGFSTEFAYQRLGADLTLSADDITEQVGDLDLDILSATGQLHFMRGGMISPYIGGGVAYVSGEAGSIDEDELDTVDLESEVEFLVNAGLNVGLGRSFSIFVDGKYIMYEARGEGDSDGEALDLNPLIIAGGVKFRF
ncbi:MAG TPA: OmpW family outer membrane protein [Thermoanaerobaculia bacterium]|nr:OmpW family outer membrane protein [Thermoanaerobaculia bacterium]